MPVAFIGGGVTTSAAASVTALTVTFAPTTGHVVSVGWQANSNFTAPSCTDNNSNALTLINAVSNMVQFYGTVSAGATEYRMGWTTARRVAAAVVEFSGVVSTGATATATANNNTALISLVTVNQNSFALAAIGSAANTAFTAGTGAILEQIAGGSGNTDAFAFVDNTATTIGQTVTCSTTQALSPWAASMLEISPAPPGTGAAVSWISKGLAGYNRYA